MTTAALSVRHAALSLVLGPVLAWELAGRALGDACVLAPPSAIVVWLAEHRTLLLRALGATLANAAAGFVLGRAIWRQWCWRPRRCCGLRANG